MRDFNLTMLQLIPCNILQRMETRDSRFKCCKYRPAYTLCGNSHTRAKKTFGAWFTWWIGVAKWLSWVVGDVARGVWPMAAYLQTMVGRGPSPHHLGTSDRIRPRIAWKEKLQEPPYLRLKLTFSCRFSSTNDIPQWSWEEPNSPGRLAKTERRQQPGPDDLSFWFWSTSLLGRSWWVEINFGWPNITFWWKEQG